MFKFELGVIVKDFVTKFEGMVLGRTEYMTGCIQYGICPQKLTKDGSFPNWQWLDESRLVLIGMQKKLGKESSGGPSSPAPECN